MTILTFSLKSNKVKSMIEIFIVFVIYQRHNTITIDNNINYDGSS